MLYIESPETDPHWNLALEQYLFDTAGQSEDCFMLWRNSGSVIVGKHQNTYAEINGSFLASEGIPAVRRLSGGGAVYHDLGNINFTYIIGKQDLQLMNLQMFCAPLVEILEDLGAEARITGRNDITVKGRKFSGNSQYVRGERLLHHGTILFQTDLTRMQQALTPSHEKGRARGTSSVSSRVINLSEVLENEISQEEFQNRFADRVLGKREHTVFRITKEADAAVRELVRRRYGSWEWNYGASPACEHKVRRYLEHCGTVEVSIQEDKGRIASLRFSGDFFGERPLEELEALFQNRRLETSTLIDLWNTVSIPSYLHGICLEGFLSLFPQ